MFNESSIKALFDTCSKFTIVSGLKLNKEKSQIIWLGPWKNKVKAPCGTVINKHLVHVLRISIPRNPESHDALNIDSCINKMKKQFNVWSSISLTLFGKNTCCKINWAI